VRSIRVERTLDVPIEAVFDVLADHARYDRFRALSSSELVREGDPAPNGVGAVRRVGARPFLRFEEEITAFDRPSRLDYVITKLNVPFSHDGGQVRLEPRDGGTHVTWTSSFSVPLSGGGPVAERVWALMLRRGFTRTLEDAERLSRG
jgi:uncharacterized protein YndB with AHSA1/START domain